MTRWPNRRILDLLGIELPILQAPMAGASGSPMAIAVSNAGGLGALPCAMLSAEQAAGELHGIRQQTSRPINVNFFCHQPPRVDAAAMRRWQELLRPYYEELQLEPPPAGGPTRGAFNEAFCDLLEACKPEVVSFHFGLPEESLLARVKATGAKILSTATSVAEATWLESHGCDAVIAQGIEAGGHRGMFLSGDVATQAGTLSLVPQIVDAIQLPVIAAGGIGDARGIAACLALGAAAVQLGTAYLLCPEATISPLHRQALKTSADQTVITNIFSGRPARGIRNRIVAEIGPMSPLAPDFPLASLAIAPLRKRSEAIGSLDFMQLWAGQAAGLCRELPADQLTRSLAAEALEII